jgi:lysophospholipase L1-like esterase
MSFLPLRRWSMVLLSTVLALQGCASAPPALPAAVNTDPATRPIVLPTPARAELPSIFMIGDSTVRNGFDDGQGLGAEGQWGWGTPFATYFDPQRINVVNRAVGGLSSRTYLTSGHWERTRALIQRGDLVLMQFGHNDSSAINDKSRARGTIRGTGAESQHIVNALTGKEETVYSYGAYLRRYVAEIRAAGATAVICSPVPRKRWDEAGRIARNDRSYASWAAEVAHEQGIAFIDLNELAARRYEQLGREAVMGLFPRVTPDETVHTNWAGAALNAQLVVQALQQQQLLGAAFFKP